MIKKIQEILKLVAAVVMIALSCIAIFAVIWRLLAKVIPFIDGSELYWANECQLLLLHWVVVIGMILVYIYNTDIRITLFYDRFNPAVQRILTRCFYLFDIFVFFVIAFFGMRLVKQQIATPTSALGISRGLFVYFPYVLLAVFVVVFSVCQIVASFKNIKKEEEK